MKNLTPLPSLLRHPLARRHAQQRERMHQVHNQRLAWQVQEILAGCGLTQDDYSVAGGRTVHFPQVLSVVDGPPMGLNIRLLPGQMPDDFTARASAIAYDLGMAEVRVVTLGAALIRLDLLPGPSVTNSKCTVTSAQDTPRR
ncbi:MAG: hypothetical protein ACRDRO_14775 [Pseudonocardiaceae bacterium]